MILKILFEALINNGISDVLSGEITFHDANIIYTYDLAKNSDEIEEYDYETNIDEDEDSTESTEECFDDVSSKEELLRNTYDKDIEIIENYICIIGDSTDRTYTEPIICNNVISFRIF